MLDKEILLEIVQRVQDALKAETTVFSLAEDNGQTVHHIAAVGKYAEQMEGKRAQAATSGICGVAFQSTCPVLVSKTEGDSRVRQDYAQAWGIKTALAIPLYDQNELLGAFMIMNRIDGSLFDAEAEKILTDLAADVTPVIAQLLSQTGDANL